jgi:MFS family permease
MMFANADGVVTRPSLQGGIVSIYYAGSLLGGFFAGAYSDKYG